MKRLFALAVAILFLAMPLFSEAQDPKTLLSDLKVKDAKIFYVDEGVFVSFTFFEPAEIYQLTVPVKMLKIEVGNKVVGTRLVAKYVRVDSTLFDTQAKPIEATLRVSQKAVAEKWLSQIDKASKQYEDLMKKDVIPTIKK